MTVFGYVVAEEEDVDKEIWKRFFAHYVFWLMLVLNLYLVSVHLYSIGCFGVSLKSKNKVKANQKGAHQQVADSSF